MIVKQMTNKKFWESFLVSYCLTMAAIIWMGSAILTVMDFIKGVRK